MPRRVMVLSIASAAIAIACHSPLPIPPAAPKVELHPLSGLVGQPVIVAPVQFFVLAPELGWEGVRGADVLRALDTALTTAFSDRIRGHDWTFADAVEQTYARNSTYATDPRFLSAENLKAPRLEVGARLTEPLASQVRTMVAFHEAGKLVLIPVELRLDRTKAGAGQAVLRLVLVDARTSEIRWVGEVTGDTATAFTRTLATSVASRAADLIAAP